MLNWFQELLEKFGRWLLSVLPTSPFRGFLGNFKSAFSPYLGYLNYFVPISDFLVIIGAFLSVVVVYYAYSIIMRWVKML